MSGMQTLEAPETVPARGGLMLAGAFGLRTASQFAVLIAFARLGGAEEAASFILATAIVTPLAAIAELAGRQLYVLGSPGGRLAPYLDVRLLAFAAMAVVVLLAIPWTGVAFTVVLLLIALKVVDGLADLFHGQLQAQGMVRLMAALIGANALISISFVIALVRIQGSAEVALLASVTVSTVFLALSYVLMLRLAAGRTAMRRDDTPVRWKLVRAGAPVSLGVALTGLVAVVPQYALAASRDPSELTEFAFIVYVIVALDLLVAGLSQARLSLIRSTLSVEGAHALGRTSWGLILRFSAVLVPVGILALLAMPTVVSWLASTTVPVQTADLVAVVCIVALLPVAPVLILSLNAMGRHDSTLVVAVAGGAIVLVASAVLIPEWGATGALFAMGLGYAARSLGLGAWVSSVTR